MSVVCHVVTVEVVFVNTDSSAIVVVNDSVVVVDADDDNDEDVVVVLLPQVLSEVFYSRLLDDAGSGELDRRRLSTNITGIARCFRENTKTTEVVRALDLVEVRYLPVNTHHV